MAMLAEPRQRKRYNLAPKGKALYEDENRFGTKMLERMGWKKGQGLGAKEDGSKDFIRIRYKNDALGLGFEERDDQWTQHEQSFNGLLKTLNNDDESISCMENDKAIESENDVPERVGFGFQETSKRDKTKVETMKEKISGVSLEERSKQSKARLHYKKFTKGKDLAQYSEKDLANIFGKKAVDVQQHDTNDFYQSLNNTFGESREISSGVQTINTGVSVYDYFKTKIELRKATDDFDVTKNGIGNSSTSNKVKFEEDKEHENTEINEDTEKKDKQIFYSNLSVNDYFKNKMEALKRIKKSNLSAGGDKNLSTEVPEDTLVKKKKKSKKEIKDRSDACLTESVEKKSKKNKNKSTEESYESEGIKKEVELSEKETKYDKNCEIEKIEKLAHTSKKQKKKRRTEDVLDYTLDKVEKKSIKNKDCDVEENDESFQIMDDAAKETQKRSKTFNGEGKAELHLEDCTETKNEAELIKKVKKSDKIKYCAIQETCEKSEIKDDAEKAQNKSKKCDIGEAAELHLVDSTEMNNEAEVIKKVKKSKKCEAKEKAEPSLDNSSFLPVENKSKENKLIVRQENVDEIDEIETNSKVIKKEEKSKKCVLVESIEFETNNKSSKSKKEKQNVENCISNAMKRKSENSPVKAESSNLGTEPLIEIDLTQEPTKKKKKRKTKNVENMEISNLDNSNEETARTENQVIKEESAACSNENVVNISKPIEQNCEQHSIKPKKAKRNQVSSIENNKSIENIEIVELDDSSDEERTHNPKNQVIKEQTTDSTSKNVITTSKPIEENSDQPLIKPKKAKRKQVSSTAKNVFITDVNFQALDLEEIKNQYQAFNIYPISSFCAEKFRNINLNCFTGSILPQLEGYGLTSDLHLDVRVIKSDEQRITNLWKCALNKYVQLDESKKTYKQYLTEAIHARKTRKKLPKLNVKTLKRKNVFQVL